MSFWSGLITRFFFAPRREAATFYDDAARRLNAARRALVENPANRQFALDILNRLEGAGLRINSALNRELVVIRALHDCADDFETDDLARVFADRSEVLAENSPDLLLFLRLASESNAFYGFDDFERLEAALPNRMELGDKQVWALLSLHSQPIFDNASSITIVNEHVPGTYLEEKLRRLEALGCGDFAILSVLETRISNRLAGLVTLRDGRSASFEIENEKRPDLTALFTTMNALVAPLGRGAFTVVLTGGGEDLIAIYLRADEQIRFEEWARLQRYADGSSPPARLE